MYCSCNLYFCIFPEGVIGKELSDKYTKLIEVLKENISNDPIKKEAAVKITEHINLR